MSRLGKTGGRTALGGPVNLGLRVDCLKDRAEMVLTVVEEELEEADQIRTTVDGREVELGEEMDLEDVAGVEGLEVATVATMKVMIMMIDPMGPFELDVAGREGGLVGTTVRKASGAGASDLSTSSS